MPTYTFECYFEYNGCGNIFDISCNRDKIKNKKPKCPQCNKTKSVFRNFNNDIYIFDTSKKTLGALAERNSNRMSEDEKQHLLKKYNNKKPFTGKLPKGAHINPVNKDGNRIISTRKGKNFGRISHD